MKNSFFLLVPFLLPVILSCSPGIKSVILEAEPGLTIRVTDLKKINSESKVLGFIEIENSSNEIKKVSNKELFLFCGDDSASANVKMPGEWEIDKGLINVVKSKTVRYQVYWPITCDNKSEVFIRYIKVLNREEQ